MDKRERQARALLGERELEVCRECVHYQPHYIHVQGSGNTTYQFSRIALGHCSLPERVKERWDWDTCEKFELRLAAGAQDDRALREDVQLLLKSMKNASPEKVRQATKILLALEE